MTRRISICLAREEDIPKLAGVERSAAKIFRHVGKHFLLDGPTVAPSLLRSMAASKHLWVAIEEAGEPVGFIGGYELRGSFYVAEISIAEAAQGKGIGKTLMRCMVEDVKIEGFLEVTLVTYRDLPWNGPWYRRLGFEEVEVGLMGKEYERLLEAEKEHGIDIEERCIMRMEL